MLKNKNILIAAGVKFPLQEHGTIVIQLEALGFKSLGWSNGWDEQPENRATYNSNRMGFVEVVGGEYGRHIDVNFAAKLFFFTDSGD